MTELLPSADQLQFDPQIHLTSEAVIRIRTRHESAVRSADWNLVPIDCARAVNLALDGTTLVVGEFKTLSDWQQMTSLELLALSASDGFKLNLNKN